MNEITDGGARRLPVALILTLVVVAVALIGTFWTSLSFMAEQWQREEYSHGYLIPVIALFLLWRQRRDLLATNWRGMWFGVAMVVFGLTLMILGELSAIYTIVQYAFLITLAGLVMALVGGAGMRYLWVPLVYLVFMIPLPAFLYNNLSSQLQLISSEIGVAVIRAFGVSVYLEGNVIDLGIYQLQVVEACSGLRYLFPLMSFGFLCAYLFRGRWWQRTIVFLSSIPLTVLMNSFRIGVIGVLVNRWGIEQAEGFLHSFEGWIIFMACVGLLFLEIILLMKITGDKRTLSEAFNVDSGDPIADPAHLSNKTPTTPLIVGLGALLLTAFGAQYLQERPEVAVPRASFVDMPATHGDWTGRTVPVEQQFLDTLQMEDWHSASYRNAALTSTPVTLWVAYYSNQRKGASAHSPRSCLPGGGWRIDELANHDVANVPGIDGALTVNRMDISYGEQRTLVYYWFKQRERHLTNEYLVKWYLFWDAFTRNRTDGALIRVTMPVGRGMNIEQADEALSTFIRESYPAIATRVPD
ncbi:MAG: VPLPA-CTERM-specific exosortase XrtD [Gammaproteobacteria bacterium]